MSKDLVELLRRPYGNLTFAEKQAVADLIEKMEAKIKTYEQHDGMDGAVVCAIRELLNHYNVPKAAFIDDHVGNAIWQRNGAEAKLAKAVEMALEECPFREDTGSYNDWWHDRRTALAELTGGKDVG